VLEHDCAYDSPILTLVKTKMGERDAVWRNSLIGFDTVMAGGYKSYVGLSWQELGGEETMRRTRRGGLQIGPS
jgi:hypothetical protein